MQKSPEGCILKQRSGETAVQAEGELSVKRLFFRAAAGWLVCLALLLCTGCGENRLFPLPVSSTPDDAGKDYGTPQIEAEYEPAMAAGLLKLMNDARKTDGEPPLTMDEGAMMDAARTRAREITAVFDHQRPNGDNWATAFSQHHVNYRYAGENIASGQPTAESAYNAFWNSETHRDNMLKAVYTHVSIVSMRYDGVMYWVQLFRG